MKPGRKNRLSADLCNISMLFYMTWLLLPMAQAALHAITGALAVGMFGVGVLLDGQTLPGRWRSFLPRVFFALALPLALFFFLHRGGGEFTGYIAMQGMFWFPLLWCAYARERGEARLYRFVKPLLMLLLVVTTLTTLGWLVQGLLRGDHVYAYARSLGSGEPGRESYLRELMLRNIGGYDFIYASVLLLPVTFYGLFTARGRKRAGVTLFLIAQLAMIVLSQYTYAIVFTAVIVAMELLAGLFRTIFKKLTVGASLWCTVPLLAALWLLRIPLSQWAGGLAAGLGFENAAYSLTQLSTLLSGGAVDAGSRLAEYKLSIQGIAASPLVGSMLSGNTLLGMHSDLLDLLSGIGVLGTAAFALGAWLIGRGAGKDLKASPAFAHLALGYVFLFFCLLLGTVFYSREIPLVLCLTSALLLPMRPVEATPTIPTP
ncbi:MAG: hypothetical protein LLF96_12310 [Eubacteriales bacterium]|nr:hypothetical protein [Eubacteriales bacterium]